MVGQNTDEILATYKEIMKLKDTRQQGIKINKLLIKLEAASEVRQDKRAKARAEENRIKKNQAQAKRALEQARRELEQARVQAEQKQRQLRLKEEKRKEQKEVEEKKQKEVEEKIKKQQKIKEKLDKERRAAAAAVKEGNDREAEEKSRKLKKEEKKMNDDIAKFKKEKEEIERKQKETAAIEKKRLAHAEIEKKQQEEKVIRLQKEAKEEEEKVIRLQKEEEERVKKLQEEEEEREEKVRQEKQKADEETKEKEREEKEKEKYVKNFFSGTKNARLVQPAISTEENDNVGELLLNLSTALNTFKVEHPEIEKRSNYAKVGGNVEGKEENNNKLEYMVDVEGKEENNNKLEYMVDDDGKTFIYYLFRALETILLFYHIDSQIQDVNINAENFKGQMLVLWERTFIKKNIIDFILTMKNETNINGNVASKPQNAATSSTATNDIELKYILTYINKELLDETFDNIRKTTNFEVFVRNVLDCHQTVLRTAEVFIKFSDIAFCSIEDKMMLGEEISSQIIENEKKGGGEEFNKRLWNPKNVGDGTTHALDSVQLLEIFRKYVIGAWRDDFKKASILKNGMFDEDGSKAWFKYYFAFGPYRHTLGNNDSTDYICKAMAYKILINILGGRDVVFLPQGFSGTGKTYTLILLLMYFFKFITNTTNTPSLARCSLKFEEQTHPSISTNDKLRSGFNPRGIFYETTKDEKENNIAAPVETDIYYEENPEVLVLYKKNDNNKKNDNKINFLLEHFFYPLLLNGQEIKYDGEIINDDKNIIKRKYRIDENDENDNIFFLSAGLDLKKTLEKCVNEEKSNNPQTTAYTLKKGNTGNFKHDLKYLDILSKADFDMFQEPKSNETESNETESEGIFILDHFDETDNSEKFINSRRKAIAFLAKNIQIMEKNKMEKNKMEKSAPLYFIQHGKYCEIFIEKGKMALDPKYFKKRKGGLTEKEMIEQKNQLEQIAKKGTTQNKISAFNSLIKGPYTFYEHIPKWETKLKEIAGMMGTSFNDPSKKEGNLIEYLEFLRTRQKNNEHFNTLKVEINTFLDREKTDLEHVENFKELKKIIGKNYKRTGNIIGKFPEGVTPEGETETSRENFIKLMKEQKNIALGAGPKMRGKNKHGQLTQNPPEEEKALWTYFHDMGINKGFTGWKPIDQIFTGKAYIDLPSDMRGRGWNPEQKASIDKLGVDDNGWSGFDVLAKHIDENIIKKLILKYHNVEVSNAQNQDLIYGRKKDGTCENTPINYFIENLQSDGKQSNFVYSKMSKYINTTIPRQIKNTIFNKMDEPIIKDAIFTSLKKRFTDKMNFEIFEKYKFIDYVLENIKIYFVPYNLYKDGIKRTGNKNDEAGPICSVVNNTKSLSVKYPALVDFFLLKKQIDIDLIINNEKPSELNSYSKQEQTKILAAYEIISKNYELREHFVKMKFHLYYFQLSTLNRGENLAWEFKKFPTTTTAQEITIYDNTWEGNSTQHAISRINHFLNILDNYGYSNYTTNNPQSSRSHKFIIFIFDFGGEEVKLILNDLAGIENFIYRRNDSEGLIKKFQTNNNYSLRWYQIFLSLVVNFLVAKHISYSKMVKDVGEESSVLVQSSSFRYKIIIKKIEDFLDILFKGYYDDKGRENIINNKKKREEAIKKIKKMGKTLNKSLNNLIKIFIYDLVKKYDSTDDSTDDSNIRKKTIIFENFNYRMDIPIPREFWAQHTGPQNDKINPLEKYKDTLKDWDKTNKALHPLQTILRGQVNTMDLEIGEESENVYNYNLDYDIILESPICSLFIIKKNTSSNKYTETEWELYKDWILKTEINYLKNVQLTGAWINSTLANLKEYLGNSENTQRLKTLKSFLTSQFKDDPLKNYASITPLFTPYSIPPVIKLKDFVDAEDGNPIKYKFKIGNKFGTDIIKIKETKELLDNYRTNSSNKLEIEEQKNKMDIYQHDLINFYKDNIPNFSNACISILLTTTTIDKSLKYDIKKTSKGAMEVSISSPLGVYNSIQQISSPFYDNSDVTPFLKTTKNNRKHIINGYWDKLKKMEENTEVYNNEKSLMKLFSPYNTYYQQKIGSKVDADADVYFFKSENEMLREKDNSDKLKKFNNSLIYDFYNETSIDFDKMTMFKKGSSSREIWDTNKNPENSVWILANNFNAQESRNIFKKNIARQCWHQKLNKTYTNYQGWFKENKISEQKIKSHDNKGGKKIIKRKTRNKRNKRIKRNKSKKKKKLQFRNIKKQKKRETKRRKKAENKKKKNKKKTRKKQILRI